jgi:hypothetical protein
MKLKDFILDYAELIAAAVITIIVIIIGGLLSS